MQRKNSTESLPILHLRKQTRYCVKWKSSEGKLVLKITDNVSCIKFKTYSSIFLNRFEALNLSLMQKMQNTRIAEEPTAEAAEVGLSPPDPAAPAAPTSSGPASGGVTKKKKPKKKK
ncbi:hypothetical protein VKT23_014332 [Stygiomarasmius scandens]|uniref:SRP9 domain-containing protein n=1 Tax=Marasmiellus scandens TaxID=2682957 RepID=A0ABR1J623_9AGAR